MKYSILGLILIMIQLDKCNPETNNQMKEYKMNSVVEEYVSATTDPEDIKAMKDLLTEAIEFWKSEYSSMGFYKEEDFIISDLMIFGKDKDKVLLFVHALLKDTDDGEVKLLTGKLEDDEWKFYYAGKPTFYYEYSEELRKGQKFTHHEIMVRTIDQLVEDGLVTFYDAISQSYIKDKW